MEVKYNKLIFNGSQNMTSIDEGKLMIAGLRLI